MSLGFVSRKVLGALVTLLFVVCFNFFLFRVVETDPVATLFRGRNLTQEQRVRLEHQFGLDKSKGGQFVSYLEQTAKLNFGRSYESNAPVSQEIKNAAWPTIALVGVSTLLSTIFGVLIGIVAAWKRRSKTDYGWTGFTMATYAMPDFWLGMLLLVTLGVSLGLFPIGGIVEPGLRRDRRRAAPRPGAPHVPPVPDSDDRLPRRVRARDALVAPRHDARGLPDARARKGPARHRGPEQARRPERAAPGRDADRDQLRVHPLRARSRSRRSTPGRASGFSPTTACAGPTCRCCRASSSSSARPSSSSTSSRSFSTAFSIRGCGPDEEVGS